MKHQLQHQDQMPDELEYSSEVAFKFVYTQAVDPDFAENLVEEMKDD